MQGQRKDIALHNNLSYIQSIEHGLIVGGQPKQV